MDQAVTEADPDSLELVRVVVGDVMLAASGPHDLDRPDLDPDRNRVRSLVGTHGFDPALVPMATLIRARDGAPMAPLRTFSGGLAHENGLMPFRKSGRCLGWQGENQADMLVRAASLHSVVSVGTESVRFQFADGVRERVYTGDIELIGEDGRSTLLEMKRDERDLADPDYCRTLAIVAEICRACDIAFRIVFAREVFLSRAHRARCHRFAARSFHRIGRDDALALRRHAEATGGRSTLSGLRDALRPGDRRSADALVQAMTVARAVEIDLERPLTGSTPVVLHPSNLSA